MKTYVLLSLAAAVLYGLGNPLVRIAQNAGLSQSMMLLATSIGGIVIMLISMGMSKTTIPTTPMGMTIGVIIGALWTIAFLLWAKAFDPALGGSGSVILLVVGINPFIASAISMTVFKEWHTINMGRYIVGGVCIAIGLTLVITSRK